MHLNYKKSQVNTIQKMMHRKKCISNWLADACWVFQKIQQTINNNNKKRRKTIEKKEGIDRGEGKERYASNSRKEFYPRIGSQQEQSREGERVKRRMDENKNQRTRNDIERKILKNAYHIFN